MASLLFKSQLQEYAQKACISAPVYETSKEGPPHVPNFKASVIINGVRYESPDRFRNRKLAEHAVAQIALQELLKAANGEVTTTNPVYETGLCKNLLQEYTQKMSLPVPSYKCSKEGEGHAASFTSTVEIAGICYQGGPAKSKKAAEIKAARTALTAIQAQQGFQGNLASPTTNHVDGFSGSWSSQAEVHAGMKRDRAAEQPSTSGRRKGKRNKKYKASRKKKEVIEVSTEKEKILGETSSNGTENGQERASAQNATAINIDDTQKNPKGEMSIDEGVDIKQEEGLGSTDNQEQLLAEVVALVDAKLENQGADIVVDTERNDENAKLEKIESVDGNMVVDSEGNIEESNQEKNEIECGDMVVDSQGTYENDKQKKNESQGGDMVSVPQGVDEQGKQVTTEDTDECCLEKGQNKQVLIDPLPVEKETTQQELLDPLMDHEDCN
ncbi:hypothetical protein SUGI_0907370 [Cryptomeria japonica]|uniref:double-stranded RNA-binding protein 8 n=1 Tax=Cryptomeria japonica TaxID=3369 RepID=UPI002414B9C8|nr:double-stranded RNA-binding protein 8 [Cryptomeria japonica]XP_057826615.1 double-stranded RNA-binding protein 8 [Cryptomeria japonica]XP_057826622.1 double-stranded RNA-binding protein 8 [Cryptomeria japonica]XP_057826634.1 double-stranded RNA-binding protein 8 [Cryptomeria japonica]GLJ43596.1 hypothetical protein SUGI_0907370 [Cryptomeria japonica]